MRKLNYSREEILAEHDYAAEHIVAGRRLHGGFDAKGKYLSPRTLIRKPAVQAWAQSLRDNGGAPLEVDASLLGGVRFPNFEQQKLLIKHGLEQTFWNTLTINGVVEARGRVLSEMQAPDMDKVIDGEVSETVMGHLNKGLFEAHGFDEGGKPDEGVGGHDEMWFAIRDLVFGARAYPQPSIPESIARPDRNERLLPDINEKIEKFLLLMMNVLMIEVRAENLFAQTERILLEEDLFVENRENARFAAEVVNRLRQDESIHVDYLSVLLGEMRDASFRSEDGMLIPGKRIIDGLWEVLKHWQVFEQPKLARDQQRTMLSALILELPRGQSVLAEFESLEDLV